MLSQNLWSKNKPKLRQRLRNKLDEKESEKLSWMVKDYQHYERRTVGSTKEEIWKRKEETRKRKEKLRAGKVLKVVEQGDRTCRSGTTVPRALDI